MEYGIRGPGPNGSGPRHTFRLMSYKQVSLGFSREKCDNSNVILPLLKRIMKSKTHLTLRAHSVLGHILSILKLLTIS